MKYILIALLAAATPALADVAVSNCAIDRNWLGRATGLVACDLLNESDGPIGGIVYSISAQVNTEVEPVETGSGVEWFRPPLAADQSTRVMLQLGRLPDGVAPEGVRLAVVVQYPFDLNGVPLRP